MRRWLNLLGMVLGFVLISYFSLTIATAPNLAQMPVDLGQNLPVTAQAEIAGQTIDLEVARTQTEQAIGLMHRTSLADNRGMLFIFEPPQSVRFWMKNVLIPLDMIFLQNGQVAAIEAVVPPCDTEPCPTYGPDIVVDGVIELRGGRSAELGIEQGNRVQLKFLESARP